MDSSRLTAALDALVERGVLEPAQAGAVASEFAAQPAPARPGGLRGRLGEVAGYLGASLVLGATVLFLGEHWEQIGRNGRIATLVAVAVVLFGCGVAVRQRSGSGNDVHRRLSSTLLNAAATAAGFATYAALDHAAPACGVTLAVALAGYVLARSALGLLTAAAAAVGAYAAVLADVGTAFGLGLVVLGVLSAALAHFAVVAERRVALAIGVALGLTGAQTVLVDSDNALCYAMTALVAAACFVAYVRGRDWIALAGGVVGATLVVPEFLYDVTDGSLGASGAMLIAGLTLLAGGLAGLRLRATPAI